MMDVKELVRHLAPNATEVSVRRAVYPDGKFESGRYTIGNIQGDKGDSMSVTLTGRTSWKVDGFQQLGEGGDLLDLIMHRKHLYAS